MSNVILCNLSDAKKVIDEERFLWITNILTLLNVPDEIIEASDINEYRYNMEEIGIEVELHSNGNVDVYKKQWHTGATEYNSGWLPPTNEHLVAQWKEPSYIKKKEGNSVYYEIHLNEWSISNIRRRK